MANSRFTITRNNKGIGFLEVAEPVDALATLSGIEGDERGLAIVLEVNDGPASAIVFPVSGESIDVATPLRWSLEGVTEGEQTERRARPVRQPSLRNVASFLNFGGEILTRRRDHYDFEFRMRSESRPTGFPFRLSIDDESEDGFLHLHFSGGSPPYPGILRVRLRTRSGRGDIRGDVFFGVEGADGFGEGYLRGYAQVGREEGQERAKFEFFLDFFGPGRAMGHGRFAQSGLSDLSFLWLIQQAVSHVATVDRPASFGLWVGWLKYAGLATKRLVEQRKIAALLARETPLTTVDVGAVVNWLASAIPQPGSEAYARTVAPLLAHIQREPLLERPHRLAIRDLTLEFGASVSPVQAIAFLTALARSLSHAGGRLCLTGTTEESR